jgi:hypothetical protein
MGVILAVFLSGSAEADNLLLTGVQVSPDARRIVITCDAPGAKHQAFIVGTPARLVIDLDSVTLGKVPTKIPVDRGSIREIRVGHAQARTRVVVDFGEQTVPPFKIARVSNLIVVALEQGAAAKPPAASVKPVAAKPRAAEAAPAVKEPIPVPRSTPATPRDSVGVRDNLVVVEFRDPNFPKRTHRMAVEMDFASRAVRTVTLSDSDGSMKRFDVAAPQPQPQASAAENKVNRGPRKNPDIPPPDTFDKPKPVSRSIQEPAASTQRPIPVRAAPFRLEQYRLEAKDTGD